MARKQAFSVGRGKIALGGCSLGRLGWPTGAIAIERRQPSNSTTIIISIRNNNQFQPQCQARQGQGKLAGTIRNNRGKCSVWKQANRRINSADVAPVWRRWAPGRPRWCGVVVGGCPEDPGGCRRCWKTRWLLAVPEETRWCRKTPVVRVASGGCRKEPGGGHGRVAGKKPGGVGGGPGENPVGAGAEIAPGGGGKLGARSPGGGWAPRTRLGTAAHRRGLVSGAKKGGGFSGGKAGGNYARRSQQQTEAATAWAAEE